MDQNELEWSQENTETDLNGYRNGLQRVLKWTYRKGPERTSMDTRKRKYLE